MKPSRKKIWLALSLICLALALVFWHRSGPQPGGTPAPGSAAKLAAAQNIATTAEAQTKFVSASTAPFTLLTLSKDTNASIAGAALKREARLKYRLSNTTETVGQLARNPKALLLENALIDSTRPLDFKIPDSLKASEDPGTYIVQSRLPINDQFRNRLLSAGATIVSYIPNNALLVRMSAAEAQLLSGFAQAVVPFEPYYKLDLNLLKQTLEGRAVNPSVSVLVFADARQATLAALDQMGIVKVSESPSPFGVQMVLENAQDVAALAQLPGIQRVEAHFARKLANDLTRAVVQVSTNTVTTNNYLDLTGRGVTVDMNDSGADPTHPDLVGRVFGRFNPLIPQDPNGHGTHVAGIIAGDGTESLTVTNAAGSIMPGTNFQFRGKAPAANLFVMSMDALSDYELQQAAARTNALISNNSWGYGYQGYDIASASFDAAVRDSLPEQTGSQPVLYVFSAGNGGGGDDNGLNGSPESIESPSTAKNVITVGAIESPRFITNEVMQITVAGTNISTPWLGSTDSSNQIASFSARGNVGIGIEGDYGRFKPDVVAPGTFVVSTRSTIWDELAYYNPTNYSYTTYDNQRVTTNGLFDFPPVFVPDNAVQLTIRATARDPLVSLPIYVRVNDVPTTTIYDVLKNDVVSLPPDAALTTGTIYFFSVQDPTNIPVTFDLQVMVATTNDLGNYFEVLSNLNDSIGNPDWYRYESGTSLAAPAVSGVLALMQEFFQTRQITNSPALMKALIINGARTVSGVYDYQVQNSINYQGWGLINLTNSLPAAFASNTIPIVNPPVTTFTPMLMFDQSPTNALSTGDSRTIKLKVDPAATKLPLRLTLVWTDPPGNPAAGIKLVNNLDLVVTNLDDPANPLVYFGNDIQIGANANVEWDTNGAPNLDFVNNVENIFLAPNLGTNYSVTVIARSVNVNAVTAQTNAIVQDYALVISSGNGQVANGIQLVQDAGIFSPNYTNITVMTNQFDPVASPNIFGQVLGNQRAGANSPLIGTNGVPSTTAIGEITLGETNQWHFYIITNTTAFTNAVFATSLPENLSTSRMGVTNTLFPDQAARLQADIDLYVTTDPLLLTLDSNAVANAAQSLSRGGFETIVSSNAASKIFYIGVKSEDHLASEYTLTVLFSLYPFNNGDNTFPGYPLPAIIPDGSPALPGAVAVTAYAVASGNVKVRRVVVTNVITHENFGDLIGTLKHDGAKPVVLNNHTYGNGSIQQMNVYEDTGGNNIPGSVHSDGPGSLANYIGDNLGGQWSLIMVDNSLTHTGRVDDLTVHIDPHLENDLPPGATNGVILANCVDVAAGGLEYDFVHVPFDGTSVQICLSNAVPVQLFVRNGALPTPTTFDYSQTVPAGGGCITVSLADLPPLQPGTLFFAIYNPNATSATVCYQVTLTISLAAVTTVNFNSTNNPTIKDDAVTFSSIAVTNNRAIASAAIGVVLDYPRVSDLALTLVSPAGERYLLFENRGGLNTTNLGHLNITTNYFGTTTAGAAAASTNVLSPVSTSGILLINYDFFTVPDSMDVYYDGVDIFSTGLINGSGQFQIPYGPGTGTSISIVMNQGNNPRHTAWVYTPTVVNEDFTYLTFTEDPTLASTAIKFAVPPFDTPGTGTNFLLSDFEAATNGDYRAPTNVLDAFGGWNLFTNFLVGTNMVSLTNNQVSVVTDPANAQAGSNFLALAKGIMNRTVTLTSGKKYTLTYYSRGPGIAGWWRGEGDATDGSDPEVDGNNGSLVGRFEFPAGVVNQAFQMEDAGQQFRYAGTNSYVQIRQSVSLDVGAGGGLTVEGWINPTNVSFQQPLVEWLAYVPTNGPTYIVTGGVTNRVPNLDIVAGPFLNPATSHYYYLLGTNSWTKSEQIAISLGGHLVTLDDANEANWVYDSFSQFGGTNRMLWTGLTNNSLGGFNWADGETNLFYTNWAAAQPSNCIGNERYVAILSPTNVQAGLWVLANDDGIYCGGPTTNQVFGVVEVNEIQTNGVQFWISVTNSTLAGDGRLYADLVDTNNVSHIIFSPPGLVQSNIFQHVALTYNTNSGVANLYYNGTNVATTNFGGVAFVPKTGGDVLLGKDMSRITNNFYGGKMDEMSIYNRNLSGSEIAAIYALSAPATNLNAFTNAIVGKFDPAITPPYSLAKAQVSLGGTTNIILGANNRWQAQGFTFTATSTNLPMQVIGQQPGMLLDSFGLAQAPPGNLYYLPEEALSDLVGQNAKGNWTLEIQDLRAGPPGGTTLPSQLVSWQLQFIFQNVNPTAVPLNPYTPSTNTVPAGKTAYFTVDVPAWAHYATNILVSSTSPVDLLFNQTTPPTGTGAGDLTLLANRIIGVGSPVLVTNGVPPLLPGQQYYLGVRNTGPASATVVVQVDYDIITLSNSVPVKGFLNTNDQVQYFAFDVTSNAVEATFQVLKVSSNVDLVVSQGVPLPTLTSTAYGSFNAENEDENIYVLTNSAPVPLSAGRWYLGVFKRVSEPASFSVLAKELDPPLPNIIDLVDNVPFNFTTGPGAALTNFFRFAVSNTPASMRFELYNLTGNGDLTVQTNAAPLAPAFFASSQQPGVGVELVFVHTNSFLTNLNSQWYLGVPNHETNSISYTIVASIDTNSYFPAFPGAEGAGGGALGGRFGDVYHVVNLNDSGFGSLRYAVSSATTNRTVVFDVAGTINLLSPLVIDKSNLTIAGQTAPGEGITVSGSLTSVENAHDVVIRFVRFRQGDANVTTNLSDAFHFNYATNVMADHVTASLAMDSGLSALWSTNVTVQWSMIANNLAKSLACSTNPIPNGLGSRLRFGNGALTFHHNLYADNSSASPRLGDNLKLDFVNNVVYNWGILPGYSTNDIADNPLGFTNYLNYVGNYLIAGQDTATNMFATAFLGGTTNTWIYQTNNLIDSNTNGILDGANTQWQMFTNDFVPAFYTRTNLVFPALALSVDEAFIAYERVLNFAGPSMDKRDALDAKTVKGVRTQTQVTHSTASQPAGLVSWWPAECNANDIAGPNNGTLQGGLGFTSGEVGQAFNFSNTNEEVFVPASASLNVGTGTGFTLECWISPTDVTKSNPIFEWNSLIWWGVHFYIDPGQPTSGSSGPPGPGQLYANIVDNAGNWHQLGSSAGAVVNNVFQHVALTYDQASGVATIYRNGRIVSQLNVGSFTPQTAAPYDLYLGRRPGPSGQIETFSGRMDESKLFNRALSQTEIQAIYNSENVGTGSTLVTLPFLDSDQDGAPDFWEMTLGENPTNATASLVDRDGDGYSDLEEYINWLGAPHALTVTNTPVGVDLVQMFGKTGNLSFSVTNSFNGLVYLTNVLDSVTNVMGGITNVTAAVTNTGPYSNSFAIFMPTNSTSGGTNYYGYAGFDVYVTNNDTIAYYGPVKVSVLVSAVPIVYAPINTNTPPVFTATPTNQSTNELTLLTVTNAATTANPNLTLSYTVSLAIDTNAMIANGWPLTYATTVPSPVIDTNGVITWTPSEAQGPGVYIITTIATDNSFPPLSTANSFSVTVNEVNLAPFWPTNVPSQTNYNIAATATLVVFNTAADLDIPPNPLSYVLTVSPAVTNAFISTNGIITWTPTPAQSPGVYTFMTIVTDTNAYALFNNSLSATNYFTVTVMPAAAPFVFTQPAQAVTGTNAQLNGMVTPNGLPTTAWFEWGTNTSYGHVTPVVGVGSSFNVVYTTSQISGLVTNQPYHFRLVASNAVSITFGFDLILDEANVVTWGANYVGQTTVQPGLSNVVAIAGAYDHSLALRNNGTVAAWGDNTFGQTAVPGGLKNVLAVAGGEYYSMALTNNGTVIAWGNNILNQLGVPPGLNSVVTIAGGTFSSLALRANGGVVAWGANFFSLTNSSTIPSNNAVAIAGGGFHSLAIKNDGTVVAWGDNSATQLAVPATLTNVVAIAAGNYHSLALRKNGTVAAWGDNSSGQTAVPPGLTNVVAIAAGGFHSMALKSDGTIVTWGDNSSGQSSVPVGLSNVVAIASGYFHSLALTPLFIVNPTNPIVLNLTNGVPQTNNVLAGGIIYYRVQVPTNADFATNSLLFAQAPVNVWFTTNTPPTFTNLNDVLLMPGATNAASVFSLTSAPTNIVPGAVYYLGVQNTNAFAVNFGVQVDFHFVPLISPIIPNFTITYTNGGFLLTWFAPSNALFMVQWSPVVPTTNWNTFTNIVSYNTNAFTSPTNTQFNFFDDGSQTGGFGPTRYYRLIQLPVTNNPPPGLVILTNAVPYVSSNAGTGTATDYYLYTVSTNAARVQFEVDNPSGDVTLVARKGLPVPSLVNFDYISTNAFTNSELIVILTNSTPVVLTSGDWYLAVVNISGGPVNYGVKATEWSVTGQPLTTSVSISATSFCITWNSLPGAYYHLEGLTNLTSTTWVPVTGTILAVSNTTTECVSLPSPFSFFRVSEGLVLSTNMPVIPVITLTNATPYLNSNSGGASPVDYYHFVVSSNSARAQFEINNPSGNVTLMARKGLPLPTLGTADYLSANAGTNDQLILVFTNSVPVALAPGDWYLSVSNASGGAVTYSVKATEWTVTGQPIGFSSISFSAGSLCLAWDALVGAHYYVEGNPFLIGTNWTTISPAIVATNTTANYCVSLPTTNNFFRVVEGLVLVGSTVIVPPPVVSVTYTNTGFLLLWNGPVTAKYQPQWATNLPPFWNSFTNIITSATGQFSFLDDGSQTGGGLGTTRFYRVMVVP